MTRPRIARIILTLSFIWILVAVLFAAGPQADKVAPALRRFSLDHPADGGLFVTWNAEVPTPKSLQNFKTAPGQGTPESVARQFLSRHADLFLMKAQVPDLRTRVVQESLTGYHVRFEQMVGDVPIYGGDISVHMTKQKQVESVHNAYFPVTTFSTTPAIPEARAYAIAAQALGLEGLAAPVQTKLYVYTLGGQPALIWQVLLPAHKPLGDWEYLIDAQTGAVLSQRDLARYATAQARIFDPSPVVTLRNPGLTDQNHSGSAVPAGGYLSRELLEVTINGNGRLMGPWVNTSITCRNSSSYSPCRSLQRFDDSLNYNFTRNDFRFEELMVYYHIDRMQRYIQNLGFSNVVNRSIAVDAHVNGDDNSFYRFSDRTLNFGDGGVFDAEDAEIISHEYGHAIQDSQVPGFGRDSAEAGSIGEGWGDYWSGSYHSAMSGGFQDACIGDWDATSYSRENPPCLRRMDRNKHYPESLVGEIHLDGEIWSQALWDLQQSVGRDNANKIALEANFRFSPTVSFREAANAVLAAGRSLFGEQYAGVIRSSMQRRGLMDGSATAFNVYFPVFLTGRIDAMNDTYTTGLAFYNPSSETATLQFTARGSNGQPLAGTVTRTLNPRSQEALFVSNLFGFGDASRNGWVEVVSDKDIKGFFLIMDGNVARIVDGADVSGQAARDLVFMHAEAAPDSGVNTYYYLSNPNDTMTRGSLTLYSPSGEAGSPYQFQIAAKGQIAVSLQGAGRGGYARISTEQPVTGLQIFGNTVRLAALKAVPPPTGASALFFPHFAVGGGWGTDISVTNTSSTAADLRIYGLRDDGTPLGAPVARRLEPNAQLLESVDSLFFVGGSGLDVGYLRVESSTPGLVGYTYFIFNNRESSAVPLSYQPSATLTFSHAAHNVPTGNGHPFLTGVALVNPNDTATATYTVALYNAAGTLIGNKQLTLGPRKKDARAINDILGMSLPVLGNGYILVNSDIPLFGFELFFTDDAGMISAVPAQ